MAWLKARIHILEWLLVLVLLAWGLSRVPPRHTFTADSMMKWAQVEAILQTGSSLPIYPLREIDPELKHYPLTAPNYLVRRPGHDVRIVFPVAFAWAASAWVYFAGRDGAVFLSVISFLAILTVLRRFWKVKPPWLLFTTACTSLLLPAIDFSEAAPAAALVTIGLTLALRSERLLAAFFGAALISLAAFVRMEALVVVASAGLWICVPALRHPSERRRAFAFAAGAGAFLIPLVSNMLIYGHPVGGHYWVDRAGFANVAEKLNTAWFLLIGRDQLDVFKPGFFGLTPLFGLIFLPLFSSRVRGRMAPDERTLLFIVCTYIPVAALSAPHDGYWSWGGRYLLPVVAFSVVLLDRISSLCIDLPRNARIAAVAAMVVLSLYSFWTVRRGVGIVHGASETMKQFDTACNNIQADVLIFDNPSVALQAGPCIFRFAHFLARDTKELNALLPVLKQKYPGKRLAFWDAPIYAMAASIGHGIRRSPQDFDNYKESLRALGKETEVPLGLAMTARVYSIAPLTR